MISGCDMFNFINIRSETLQQFLTSQYSPKNINGRSIFNKVEGCKVCYNTSAFCKFCRTFKNNIFAKQH